MVYFPYRCYIMYNAESGALLLATTLTAVVQCLKPIFKK